MAVCGTASTWAKVAVLLILLALILHIVGFATKYWEQVETIQEDTVFSVGLWKASNCSGGHNSACNEMSIPSSYQSTAFTATQAFQCIVLVLIVVVTIVALFYVASERFRQISIAVFITIVCFVTVTLGIIGIIIWLTQLPDLHYPGYSFGLAVVAIILLFLAGVLMIPDIRRYQSNHNGDVTRVKPEGRSEVKQYNDYPAKDYSYNRKFAPTPETNIRHYHNPNREPYNVRSPPPKYKTFSSPSYTGRHKGGSNTRTEIQTPDVYLGRDGRYRRY